MTKAARRGALMPRTCCGTAWQKLTKESIQDSMFAAEQLSSGLPVVAGPRGRQVGRQTLVDSAQSNSNHVGGS